MIKEIILKMTGLYSEMYGLRETNSMLETDLASANHKLSQLHESYEDQKANAIKNYDARRNAEEKLKSLSIDLDAAKETICDLRNKLLGEQETTDILRNARDKWMNDYNTIEQRCTELEEQLESLSTKDSEQYTKIVKLNTEKSELKQKLEQYKEDNKQLTYDNHELSEMLSYWKARALHKSTKAKKNAEA